MERDTSKTNKTCTCRASETRGCTCKRKGYEEAKYSMIESIIKTALIKHAEGNIELHKANIEVYLDNPVGIGEHSDIMEAIQAELDKMAVHIDRLEALEAYF
jgi:hypothetical protein